MNTHADNQSENWPAVEGGVCGCVTVFGLVRFQLQMLHATKDIFCCLLVRVCTPLCPGVLILTLHTARWRVRRHPVRRHRRRRHSSHTARGRHWWGRQLTCNQTTNHRTPDCSWQRNTQPENSLQQHWPGKAVDRGADLALP